jgi:hypothetical protein
MYPFGFDRERNSRSNYYCAEVEDRDSVQLAGPSENWPDTTTWDITRQKSAQLPTVLSIGSPWCGKIGAAPEKQRCHRVFHITARGAPTRGWEIIGRKMHRRQSAGRSQSGPPKGSGRAPPPASPAN